MVTALWKGVYLKEFWATLEVECSQMASELAPLGLSPGKTRLDAYGWPQAE